MTFTEAAAQVLRLVGKPLHYKEITDVAIEKDLLSHVGKSPEVTMGARLAALVKKGDKENPLVRVKPGVFALREWDSGTIERGLSDRTPALKMLEDNGSSSPSTENGGEHSDPEAAKSRPHASLFSEEEEESPDIDDEERERAELAANASELFAPEEDDDEPILGGDEEAEEGVRAGTPAAGGDDSQQGRRRRRRRRRGGRSVGGDDLPTYTVSDAVIEKPSEDGDDSFEARAPSEPREAREPREPREPRDSREGREPREGREAREPREGREPREAREPREGREAREPRDIGAVLDDLEGVALADAAVDLLAQFERQGMVPIRQVLDAARRRGRLNGDAMQAQSALSAAMRADNARRTSLGQRCRFRFSSGRVGLTDWLLDGDLRRLEREVFAAVERYREAARRSLVRRIQALPPRAIGELSMILLERLGLEELQPVRRPNASPAELLLSGKAPGPVSTITTALVVRRDGRDVGREQVTELRGSLHHFGPAFAGWIVTTGQVLSGAREEAAAAGASPVKLVDGATLARLCEEHRLAVTETAVNLPLPDVELFEALRNGNGG
jgi:hypothetical protein